MLSKRMSYFQNTLKTTGKSTTGFTMVELVVTIAIFTIITSMIMVSQRRFGGNIQITNLAYDVALSIRQAQAYGISVRRVTQAASSEQFSKSYGVHFRDTGYFVLFTDIDGNGLYDTFLDDKSKCLAIPPTGHNPECVEVFKIEKGNSISKFCAGDQCTNSEDPNKIDSLDILFHRPDPEPTINATQNLARTGASPYSNASITVTSPQGLSKTVTVSASGQISIQ